MVQFLGSPRSTLAPLRTLLPSLLLPLTPPPSIPALPAFYLPPAPPHSPTLPPVFFPSTPPHPPCPLPPFSACTSPFLLPFLRPADNVGDNVGDIAGMGADLFGSFAESTCAALVVTSVSSLGANHFWVSMCYPLLISGEAPVGIFVICVQAVIYAAMRRHRMTRHRPCALLPATTSLPPRITHPPP